MIDLSADLGEGSPDEPEIWPLITSANVACGGHTGDECSMAEAVSLARQHRVRLGAHPSYPDREHFGRRSLLIDPDALRASLTRQLFALRAFAPIHHVKPHGALYNDAHKNRTLAELIVRAMREVDDKLAIVCSDRSEMALAARLERMRVIREAFADRRYEEDGSLVPRGVPGATLTVEEAAEQAALLAREGVVIARNGSRVVIPFDTLCIHADMADASARLRAVRSALATVR